MRAALLLGIVGLACAQATAGIRSKQTIDRTADTGNYNSMALDSSDGPRISYYDYSLALDSAGKPHTAYYDTTNRDLKYASRNGSSWVKQTVDNTYGTGRHCSIGLDDTGNPHICYVNYYKSAL